MKKALSLFLTMVMLLGLALPFGSLSTSAATLKPSSDYDAILESVYDEATKTYTLTTPDHLLALAYGIRYHGNSGDYYYANKTFALGADITLNEGVQDAVAAGDTSSLVKWPDLSNNRYFHGNIDGRGHTISGIYSTTKSGTSAGLFGYAKGNATHKMTVENLSIVDSYISSTKSTTGGLFGSAHMLTKDPEKGLFLRNLYLDIDVVNTLEGTASNPASSQVGGIIGNPRASMIHLDSVVSVGTITVNNTSRVGGLLGTALGDSSFFMTITNCAFYGSIVGASKEYGLLVGRCNPTVTDEMPNTLIINNCIAGGTVSTASANQNHGAFLGYSSVSVIPTVEIENNLYVDYNGGTAKTHSGASGFNPYVSATELVAKTDLTGSAGRTTLKNNGLDEWLVADGDLPLPRGVFEIHYAPSTDYAKIMGAILDGNTYHVTTANQFLAFGYSLKNGTPFANQTISIEEDVTLNEGVQAAVAADNTSALIEWPSPNGNFFYGNIDGNGHTVSGMYMKATAASSGFFGYGMGTDNTTNFVRDLAIVDSYASSTEATFGAIFGQTNYTDTTSGGNVRNQKLVLENLYLDVDLNCTQENTGDEGSPTASSVGSIIGTAHSSTVDVNSVVSVGNITVNDTRYVGGLIGQISGEAGSTVNMTNCAYYGTIIGSAKETGLLVGRLNPTTVASTLNITNCVAGGQLDDVTTPSITGAFLGYSSASVLPVVNFTNNLYVEYLTQDGTTYDALYSADENVVPTLTNNVKVNASALYGKDASALLIDNGFTAWSAQVEGNVIPTTVRDFWFPTTNTKFVGYQISEAEGARFSLRLIGVVDSLDYDSVGFKISLTCNDKEIGTKNHTQNITGVYNTLTAVTPGGTVSYTSKQLGGNYIFALNINNIPTGCGDIDFLVRTFHKNGDVTNFDGRTMAFTVDSYFSDLTETPIPGITDPNAPDYTTPPTAVEPVEKAYTDIGYRGLDLKVTTNASLSDYNTCVADLVSAGYEKVSERVTAYNYFTRLDNETETLWVSYYGTKKQIRVTTDGQLLDLQTTPETVENPVAATVTQYANYVNLTEDTEKAPGMGYVIKADNGKLIVIDGGHAEDLEGFYALMQEVYGDDHPVIAAWIFTHAHHDHLDGAIEILKTYGEQMTVEAVYASFLSSETETKLTKLFTEIDRLEIPYIALRTGMQFYVGNVRTSILFASDDLLYQGGPGAGSDLNAHSMIFTVEYADEKVLFLGDAIRPSENTCSANWSDREWNAEACQVAHHGLNGVSSALYKKIAPKVLLWTCNMVRYNNNYSRYEHTIYLHSLDVENILAFNGTHTLTFGQFVS